MRIIVIGAGIAGSIAARLLSRAGHEVHIFDDLDEQSASQASSNLYIAHWLQKFMHAEAKRGVEVLEEVYAGQIDQPFAQGMGYAMKVNHIAQRHVIEPVFSNAMVNHVSDEGVTAEDGESYPADKVVVCTGWRASELVGDLEVYVKVGHCYLFEGKLEPGQSRLAIISPYKHEKLYQFDENRIYYADSVAVHLDTYEKNKSELQEKTLARARKHVGNLPIADMRIGYRPFVKGHDFGWLKQHSQNVWSINGGGKNGLAAYAYLADKLVKELAR